MRSIIFTTTLLAAAWLNNQATGGLVVNGVDDIGHHNSRLFSLDLDTGAFSWRSDRLSHRDMEGLATIGGQTYTVTKEKKRDANFATVDFSRGTIGPISLVDYASDRKTEVTGMTVNPLTGEMWGFLEDRGFAVIDRRGVVDLRIPFHKEIEGLAISQKGNILYGIQEDGKLYSADIFTGQVQHLVTLSEIHDGDDFESLEMLPDGALGGFVEYNEGVAFYTYSLRTGNLFTRYFDGLPLRDVEAFTIAASSLALQSVPQPGAWVVLMGVAVVRRKRKRP